jgi:hypothetical protein
MKRISLLSAGLVSAMLAGGAYAAEMTLFDDSHFRGPSMTIRGDTYNLQGSGLNDRVSSVIVRSGRWQVCTDADFGGHCRVLGPGEYPQLYDPLHDRISSARPIDSTAVYDPAYRYGYYERVVPVERIERFDRYADRGRYGALQIYTMPGFRGSTMRFDNSATTLDTRAAHEGVASLVVREGVWEVCTGLDFSGRCRVFEPGSYPRLGSFEGSPVGSLRRIG